jgi:hypothetical protein
VARIAPLHINSLDDGEFPGQVRDLAAFAVPPASAVETSAKELPDFLVPQAEPAFLTPHRLPLVDRLEKHPGLSVFLFPKYF